MVRRVPVKLTPLLLKTVIAAETPREWTVHFTHNHCGYALRRRRELHIPKYRYGYRCLWVFFHEVAHALRMIEGKFRAAPVSARVDTRLTSSHEEWIAETFAMEMLTRYGLPLTAVETHNAQKNVRQYVRAEEQAGLPIYEGVRKFTRSTRRKSYADRTQRRR